MLKELPPEIEVKTGIEDDEEIFSHRGKLYRFARECNPAEWKERGLGDIKILKTKNQVRFLLVTFFLDYILKRSFEGNFTMIWTSHRESLA